MNKRLVVNGSAHEFDLEPAERLLTTLRGRLRLTGAKEACGVGECGACTVLIAGKPRLACVTVTATVEDEVRTVEGVAEEMAALRESFAEEGGFQCGFCTPGQLMSAYALCAADDGRERTDDEIREAMVGNLCRCTGYLGINRAVRRVLDA
ncbi:(2Fe-2S)-binding protein [Nonomuraea sp. NPDC049486]|uniref:(2Fe-2S)-binding protein n=1 Tax=Nonomuraea sp. NPDC049486 TaxID=3155773 RepID=UPI0034356FCB